MSPDDVEFALFESPLDKKGNKIMPNDTETESVQPYFDEIDDYKLANPEVKETETAEFNKKEEKITKTD